MMTKEVLKLSKLQAVLNVFQTVHGSTPVFLYSASVQRSETARNATARVSQTASARALNGLNNSARECTHFQSFGTAKANVEVMFSE
jgi:hypothetical protein